MQPIESMLRQTSHRVSRVFTTETRHASRELVSAVRTEAGAWSNYVRQTPTVVERTLLSRVDIVLRSLEQRVKQRLAKLESGRTRVGITKAKRALNGVTHRKASASRARARA